MAAVAKHTFVSWVTSSLYHNVTGILFSCLVNHRMICVQVRHECWTRQGSLSCSPWKSVCHDWTATVATHSCMPGCGSILAVTASWLISVCGFCLCGVRSWKPHVVVFRHEETFESTAAMLRRESRTNSLTWEVMWFYPLRHFLKECHRTYIYIYFTILHSPDGRAHWNWTSFETCYLLRLCAA
jgi:hypothetical protein